MKLFSFILFLSISSTGVFAQKKGSLPPTPEKMPGKDPVAVIANIPPGKSKVLNWHSSGVVFRVSAVKSTISVLRKSKAATKTYPVNKKLNDIYVKLAKGDNLFVLKTTNEGGDKMRLSMTDKDMQYKIIALLTDGNNDTLIIKRH